MHWIDVFQMLCQFFSLAFCFPSICTNNLENPTQLYSAKSASLSYSFCVLIIRSRCFIRESEGKLYYMVFKSFNTTLQYFQKIFNKIYQKCKQRNFAMLMLEWESFCASANFYYQTSEEFQRSGKLFLFRWLLSMLLVKLEIWCFYFCAISPRCFLLTVLSFCLPYVYLKSSIKLALSSNSNLD